MGTTAIITFIVVAGFVWGGFIFLAVKALRGERGRRSRERDA
jgi:hypothetical protein